MEFVELLFEVRHVFVTFPRLWDHHHHGVREAAAGKNEELEAVVELLRIGTVFANNRQELLEVVAEHIAGKLHLACMQPVFIAADRVDLTIVAEVTERLRARPAWEGVG